MPGPPDDAPHAAPANPSGNPPDDALARDVFRASLELLALSILADGPAHGYALRQRLHRATGHDLPPGTLYPLLHRLEAAGHTAADWAPGPKRPRKRYHLTPAGRTRLRRDAARWQAFVARLDSLILPALRRVAHEPADPG